MRFVDLFAGLGGFHLALTALGHECVFASEIDPALRAIYIRNFKFPAERLGGDIREARASIPPHDILCAGFPCQPFSKSGYQDGHSDERGTYLDDIIVIVRKHAPEFVILENVGNFEQHDRGRTWKTLKHRLRLAGYSVVATEHVKSGGDGLLSPHHLGFPQSRERFYAVCRRLPLASDVLPRPQRAATTSLGPYLIPNELLTPFDLAETKLAESQVAAIDLWNGLLTDLPKTKGLPSFPLWSDEFAAKYPFEGLAPFAMSKSELVRITRALGGNPMMTKAELLLLLPSYARQQVRRFPYWKVKFITQNRDWYASNRRHISVNWLSKVRHLPSSHRKLEWNCKGEVRDLWAQVLQFRPSGIRAKRFTAIPALVSLTATQIPIIGPLRRYLTRSEALTLQGFPYQFELPANRELAFQAIGNAVHVGVATEVTARLLGQRVPSAFHHRTRFTLGDNGSVAVS
jgi:DNA (cytosine-5)-methyltransferase 1